MHKLNSYTYLATHKQFLRRNTHKNVTIFINVQIMTSFLLIRFSQITRIPYSWILVSEISHEKDQYFSLQIIAIEVAR